jgi:nucleoside-diphosphate-sugar epimerase
VTRDPRVERVAGPGLEHAQAAPGQIYNCGDEHQITTREWVEMSAAELGYRWGIGW